MRMAVLAAATLLVTPYLRAYDLVLLILPVAVLLWGRTGLVEKAIIFAAWLLPGVLMFTANAIQIGPIVSVALMGLLFWRIVSHRDKACSAF